VALDQIESMRCTIVLAAFETIWLPVVNLPDFPDRDLSSVRIVMAVGVPERLRDMASRMPHATQVSCFGMTEASSFLSLNYLTDTLEQRVCTGGYPMRGWSAGWSTRSPAWTCPGYRGRAALPRLELLLRLPERP
jgi:fatty-acyl-CoA synthase